MHKDFRIGLLTINVFLDYFCWDTDCQHAGWKVPCYDRSCTDNSYWTDVLQLGWPKAIQTACGKYATDGKGRGEVRVRLRRWWSWKRRVGYIVFE